MDPSTEPARRFDSDLQMFCDAPREPSMAQLRFLRWLAERGQAEHPVFGEPAGEYASPEEGGEAQDRPADLPGGAGRTGR